MYKTQIKVNFYDCDPAGILFYANLFRYAHTAYEEMLETFKLAKNFFQDKEYVMPLIHAEANYIKTFNIHEKLEIEVNISQLRESSFELKFKFFDIEHILKAEAKTVHVFVKKEGYEKVPLPKDLRDKLNANLA